MMFSLAGRLTASQVVDYQIEDFGAVLLLIARRKAAQQANSSAIINR
jgi:hypothetical protein